MYDLSIVIPARNEEFLTHTIDDILKNKRGNTQIIVGLDGDWPVIPIADHKDVVVLHYSESLGQRAISNRCVSLSSAKYIMKVDAHCSFDEGFDVKMMDKMEDDITLVPMMRNLHAFDWVCSDAKPRVKFDSKDEPHRRYQSPSGVCKDCGKPTVKELVWFARTNPTSKAYRFDKTMHFQYYNELSKSAKFKYGYIVGYKLSFDSQTIPSGIVDFLANFAGSHGLACSRNNSWFRENVSSDTVSFSSVNGSWGIGDGEVLFIGNKLQMQGITTPSIFAKMVKNWDCLTPTPWDSANNPSVEDSMCECFLPVAVETTVSAFVGSSSPSPAVGSSINSDIIDELNKVLGGSFIYSENTRCFHNGSVTLEPVRDNELNETLSIQGSCFMLTRAKWWELDICSEEFYSWGQQGVEVACKTWLSGGRVLVNRTTWYAHLFRTQGKDFGFPYKNDEKKVEENREKSRQMFQHNGWKGAVHSFEWLIDKFNPPEWTNGKTKGILYYTDNQINMNLARVCRRYISQSGFPITSATLKPTNFGNNIVIHEPRGYKTMFKQILTGLEAMSEDIVYFCEHDVLYHPDHFKFTPENDHTFYYNGNYWFLRLTDGFAIHYDVSPLSGLVAYREPLIKHFKERLALIEKKGFGYYMGFEPMTHKRVKWDNWYDFKVFMPENPNIDIAHGGNTTSKRWSQDRFIRKPKFWEESDINNIKGWVDLPNILTGIVNLPSGK